MMTWLWFVGFVVTNTAAVVAIRRERRRSGALGAELVRLKQVFKEHQESYNVAVTRMEILLAFVQEFVFDGTVSDILERYAKFLDIVCKESVSVQQGAEFQDPDDIHNRLMDLANRLAAAKKKFWGLVEIVQKTNKVFGGIRQFQVPKSYRELLKNSTA